MSGDHQTEENGSKVSVQGKSETTSQAPGEASFLSAIRASQESLKLYVYLLGLIAGLPFAVRFLDEKLHIHHVWLSAGICALPALLILLWLYPKWQRERDGNWLKEYGITGRVKDPQYFRLTPFKAGDEFMRADKVQETVSRWISNSNEPLLYLSGKSGSGKSSIISGWVIPAIIQNASRPVHLIEARVVDDPVAAVANALLMPGAIWARVPSDSEKLTLHQLVKKCARKVAPSRLLLILDQFEEFLILSGSEQRQSFLEFLHSLVSDPISDLHILMILRSDYLGLLEKLNLPSLIQHKNWEEVPPFTERDAIAFLRGSELVITSTLEQEITQEAREVEDARGTIRPVVINLFGLVLMQFESLPRHYRPGTLLRHYLAEQIMEARIRAVAPMILRRMITGNGTKLPVSLADIECVTGVERNQIRGCLLLLATAGLVREIDPTNGIWEISHDFVAGLLDRILSSWRQSLWQRSRPVIIATGISVWLVSVFVFPVAWENYAENQAKESLAGLAGLRLGGEAKQRTVEITGTNKSAMAEEEVTSAIPALVRLGVKRVRLSGTNIASVEMLRRLSGLQQLDLSHTQVTSVEALRGLTGLQQLDLSGTQVTSVEALRGLTGLQQLDLSGTQVTSVEALKGLTRLRQLNLHDTQLTNVEALKWLTALQQLDISLTQVTSVAALKGLSDLRQLDLGATQVTSLEALKGLTRLQRLDLSRTQVASVEALKGLTGLQQIDLSGTPVTSLEALKGLTGLQRLDLSRTQVASVEALKGLTGLQQIDLSGTQVTSVEALKGLTGLQQLDLSLTRVTSAEALKGLTGLQQLDLSLTQVTSVEALKGLTGLRQLNLFATQVMNLEALQGLTALQQLDLSFTRVTSVEALKGLTGLRQLDLYSTRVTSAEALNGLTGLHIRGISENIFEQKRRVAE